MSSGTDQALGDERLVRQVAAALALRLRELLAPLDATSVTLTRDEAVLAMGIVEGVANHLGDDRRLHRGGGDGKACE